MRSARNAALAAAALLSVAGCGGGDAEPSFTRDVAPILRDKCAGCHQLGGIAPFSLESAQAARTHARAIAAAVESRQMPPWLPGDASPAYVGVSERRLSEEEIGTIAAWAEAGGRTDGPALGAPPAEPLKPKRDEWVADLTLPRYVPSGESDDYRCFLLDPHLDGSAFVTSAAIRPGAASIVHHVIVFRAESDQVEEAEGLDARAAGPGWPCFGGTGLGVDVDSLDDAGWLAAWAPGGEPMRYPAGTGAELAAGSGIVVQVHYNLLHGREADRTTAQLTFVSGGASLEPATTMLLPAPVELACAADESGPLCDRGAAVVDLVSKRGASAGLVPLGLQVLCGGSPLAPRSGPVATCERDVDTRTTIHGVAGHMHLLGRSIRVELNPGTDRARVLLDIPRWDFNWQNAYMLEEPVVAEPGDEVRVTCRHDASLRRGAAGVPSTPRYIVWGEGTTDEMCLGVLQVTRG